MRKLAKIRAGLANLVPANALRGLAMILIGCSLAVSQPPQNLSSQGVAFVEEHFAQARHAEASSDFARAGREYDAILDRYPRELPELYQNAGIAYYLEHDYQTAVDRFQAGLHLKPDLIGARLFLGGAYLYSGRPALGLQHLLYAHEHDPTVESANYLGLTYSALGQSRKATEYFRFCLDRSDDKEKYLSTLLEAYVNLAAETGDRLVAQYPHSLYAHLIEAELLDRKQLYRLAAREYIEAAVSDPFDAGVFRAMAQDLKRIQADSSSQLALARYNHLVRSNEIVKLPSDQSGLSLKEVDDNFDYEGPLRKLPPIGLTQILVIASADSELNSLLLDRIKTHPNEDWKRVAVLFDQSQWEDAVEVLRHMPASAPAWPRTYLTAIACLSNNQPEKADRILSGIPARSRGEPRWMKLQWQIYDRLTTSLASDILDRFPNSAGGHYLKAQALDSRHDPEAEKEYKEAIAADPRRSGIRIKLADYYLSQTNLTSALVTVKEELDINPYSPDAHMRLGRIYIQQGHPADALPHLQAAISLEPKNAIIRADLGKALEETGNYEKAVSEYKESLLLDPAQNRLHLVLAKLYAKLGRRGLSESESATFRAKQDRQNQETLDQARAVHENVGSDVPK